MLSILWERDIDPWFSDRSLVVDPLSYFSFQPVLHNWCSKGRAIYYLVYPVYGKVNIKDNLLLMRKRSLLRAAACVVN